MSTRRTAQEVEKDYGRIKKYADTHPEIASFKEIAIATNLSECQVKKSLEKHPRVYEKLKTLILENSDKRKTNKAETKKVKNPVKKYVIDASITGLKEFRKIISDILENGHKLVLTSLTTKELDMMQKYNDLDGKDAKYLLRIAADTPDKVESVLIKDCLPSSDDCIIEYCKNKSDVILLTADKKMALDARAHGIETEFFKHTKKFTKNKSKKFKHKNHRELKTLFSTKKRGNKLVISVYESQLKNVLLISNGIEYSSGTHALNIDDDVFVASKKEGYLTFAHYKVVDNTSVTKNCRLIFFKRFYSEDEINALKSETYKAFMRAFNLKINA